MLLEQMGSINISGILYIGKYTRDCIKSVFIDNNIPIYDINNSFD
jgi:hypothetical protein